MTNEKLQKDNGVPNTNAPRYKRVIESILSYNHKIRHQVCYKSFIKICVKPMSNSISSVINSSS